ncbi:GAF domain-containing protein [Pontibacter indicus]|uniref:histidine kinase n=1 Tax=Pontibacter indicus TaxID=1317125 RepID=A0A1R3WFM9_9BACT|nr:GAF domain-containing protein [Pontibacter indicus]SIT75998.1 multi-sensor signal transduction histidine kinase [Pontibacter indicus]
MLNYQNHQVDLSNCDNEPIHYIGRIQAHGFLLILHAESFEIEQASDNLPSFLNVATPDKSTGIRWQDFADDFTRAQLLPYLTSDLKEPSMFLLELQSQRFLCFLHRAQDKLVLELERYVPITDEQLHLSTSHRLLRFSSELEQLPTLPEKADLTVRFVRQLLDYDHSMLYRFDEDWHGEVIGEETQSGDQVYLHHHFPATDIPAQARQLLVEKPIRQIANVGAQAVNIRPYLNPDTGQPAFLFRSELRNPSEIHLEYLRNMGVQASLSVSLVVQGKLWGIIACHHKSPLLVNYWKRQACLHIAQIFSSSILALQEQRDLQEMAALRKKEKKLVKHLNNSDDLQKELQRQSDALLHLTGASGMALKLGGKLYLAGTTPTQEQVEGLMDWLSRNIKQPQFQTRELAKVYPEAAAIRETASGLLVTEIARHDQEYLLYFKPEISEKRIWAGNPEKPMTQGQLHIHPRESFEQWSELIRGKSHPWTLNEQEIAQTAVKSLISAVLRQQKSHLQDLNQELQHTSELLQSKNDRLEDFTQIIAHNLRSPLSNMKGLAQMYADEPEMGAELMGMMSNVIQNMNTTLNELNVILESELKLPVSEPVYLPAVVERELQNLQAVLIESGAQVELDLEVETLKAPRVYLESIAHNLISNALKYRSSQRQPQIKIRSWQSEKGVCFSVTDNGLGLDIAKYGDKLFNLYKTFHGNKDAKGLGLYLTRIQAEALGGYVEVESTPNHATTFMVCLGKNTLQTKQ